jgi:hypothetical protein
MTRSTSERRSSARMATNDTDDRKLSVGQLLCRNEFAYAIWPTPPEFGFGFPLRASWPHRASRIQQKLRRGGVHSVLLGGIFQGSSLFLRALSPPLLQVGIERVMRSFELVVWATSDRLRAAATVGAVV